jgi:hypothetical protein
MAEKYFHIICDWLLGHLMLNFFWMTSPNSQKNGLAGHPAKSVIRT